MVFTDWVYHYSLVLYSQRTGDSALFNRIIKMTEKGGPSSVQELTYSNGHADSERGQAPRCGDVCSASALCEARLLPSAARSPRRGGSATSCVQRGPPHVSVDGDHTTIQASGLHLHATHASLRGGRKDA